MAILQQLATTPPRDRSGAMAANRLAFQISWTMCLIMNLHKTQSGYMVILDYHDDVTWLDSETEPTTIGFFQLKTDRDPWTVGKLTARAGGTSLSVIGKLYDHYLRFPGVNVVTALVTTSGLGQAMVSMQPLFDPPGREPGEPPDCPWLPEVRSRVRFSDMNSPRLKAICDKLRDEHQLGDVPTLNDRMWFVVTEITPGTHERVAKALLLELLEPINCAQQTGTLYRHLAEELRQRNNREGLATSAEDLQKRKSFTRSEFETILAQIPADRNTEADFAVTGQCLVREDLGAAEIVRIGREWRRYQVERIAPSTHLLSRLQAKVRDAVKEVRRSGMTRLVEVLARTHAICGNTQSAPYSRDYVSAMILMEWIDGETQSQIPPTRSQSEDETP